MHLYGLVELTLTSSRFYANPLWDCELSAEFVAASGRCRTIRGFWDGGTTWRLRFSPDEPGCWRWKAHCTVAEDSGLATAGGEFDIVPYEGDNPLYRHGPILLSEDRRSFRHADGTPFFWLGDTAWNGVIRGDDGNWGRFLGMRALQRFTVAQFVASHWRGDALDETGEPSCTEEHPIRVNPAFFQRIDRRVAMVNEAGIVAAPVALWSLLKTDIGYKLAEDDATRMAAYIVARYDAHQVVWLLGGDARYQEIGVERWKRIGREVFRFGHDRLAGLHPCGVNWVGEEFRGEPWYDFVGYQSGHGDGDDDLRWLVQGPPSTEWRKEPALPVVNLEPNYETAYGYQHKTRFEDSHVRRAAYWSLLVSPSAGLTYGNDAIWNWNSTTGPSEGHGGWHLSRVSPWHTGLDTPGIRSMTVLRGIFDRLEWWTLVPAPDLLSEQPGDADLAAFVAVARSAAGVVVCYSPCGGTLRFGADRALPSLARRVNPRTGEWSAPEPVRGGMLTLPSGEDWLVVLSDR